MNFDSELQLIERLKASHPNHIAAQCFEKSFFSSLSPPQQQRLMDCMRSGLAVPESDTGCYAQHASDYDTLRGFFEPVIFRQHKAAQGNAHQSEWNLGGASYDVAELGLPPLSLRIRVGRNFSDLPLSPAMGLQERLRLEERMVQVFEDLIAAGQLAGRYVSLTPGHRYEIDAVEYDSLVRSHVMFKSMAEDAFLTTSGIAADWPHGRGCFFNSDRSMIIWVGEEDHLRIMQMRRDTKISPLLQDLQQTLHMINAALAKSDGSSFAWSEDFGYLTACPSNLGTAMRASAHLQLACLTADGSVDRVKQLADPLGLSVRGLGGEHTPIGTDGTVDISPRARLFVTEADIVRTLYQGVSQLVAAERQCLQDKAAKSG